MFLEGPAVTQTVGTELSLFRAKFVEKIFPDIINRLLSPTQDGGLNALSVYYSRPL